MGFIAVGGFGHELILSCFCAYFFLWIENVDITTFLQYVMDIRITGASQNTLRGINLTLPAGKLIALMGPSGSGKSTLAHDTLFAESRRRFLDCLSTSARRLLARPEKPQVDRIDGLPPALCLEQHMPPGQSRQVLGSLTETLDYLRIIYAAIGIPHDPVTGERLVRLSPEEITVSLSSLQEGHVWFCWHHCPLTLDEN